MLFNNFFCEVSYRTELVILVIEMIAITSERKITEANAAASLALTPKECNIFIAVTYFQTSTYNNLVSAK